MGNIQTTLNEIFSTDLHVSHLRTLFTDMIDVITLFQFDNSTIDKLFDYLKFIVLYIGLIGLITTFLICPLNLIEEFLPFINKIKLFNPLIYLILISYIRNFIFTNINDDENKYIPSEILTLFNPLLLILETILPSLNNILNNIPILPHSNISSKDILLTTIIWVVQYLEPLNVLKSIFFKLLNIFTNLPTLVLKDPKYIILILIIIYFLIK